jgi:hypothetical protein
MKISKNVVVLREKSDGQFAIKFKIFNSGMQENYATKMVSNESDLKRIRHF